VSRLPAIVWYGFAAAAIVFMLAPLVVLIMFCFSDSPLLAFPITGLTLDWFGALLARPGLLKAFTNSLIVTATVGVVSTVAGTLTAIGLAGVRSLGASGFTAALTVPVMVPPLMLGIMLLSYFTNWLGIRLGLHTVILAHLVFTQPFVILIVGARMASFDFAAVDSARDLGASSLRAFLTVTLPIVRPSIVGASLIGMALSLDDFVVTFFTIGGGSTLSTYMWGMLRRGVDPTINVMAVMVMSLSIGASVLGLRATRYRG